MAVILSHLNQTLQSLPWGNAVIDSDVQPEQAKSYEVGAEYELNVH